MRQVKFLFLLMVLFSVVGVFTQQAPVFRTGTQIVPLYVTVTDREKRLVPELEQKDFEIFDNKRPQAIHFSTARSNRSPLS